MLGLFFLARENYLKAFQAVIFLENATISVNEFVVSAFDCIFSNL